MTEWVEQTVAYWRSGGMLLVPIAMVCFGIWGIYLRSREKFIRIKTEGDAVLDAWGSSGAGETYWPTAGRTPVHGGITAMLRLVVDDVNRGSAPERACMRREAEVLSLMRRDFMLLASLTAAAPLLGLLGTVIGMIATFEAVAVSSGRTGEWVAEGISQALITTQFGLAVALPGAFGLARLQRMLTRTRVLLAACRIHAVRTLAAGLGEGLK